MFGADEVIDDFMDSSWATLAMSYLIRQSG